jgi:tetratricopeptide (TPR) repeat protein
MRVETSSKRAGELVEHAMADLEVYRRAKLPEQLDRAIARLDQAREEDPDYLLALYGRAIADDLSGRAASAIEEFEQVFAANPPFVDDVEYHLGMAHYHRYNWADLDKAIEHFSAVAKRTQDPILNCRTRVALAQAFGMRMIPHDPRDNDLDEIKNYFALHGEQAAFAEKLLKSLVGTDPITIKELKSALHNAKALGLMYWSDFFESADEKIALLKRAVAELQLADQNNPNDWAIHCDLGSAWMRLGYWEETRSSLAEGRRHLTKVLEDLRPNYGFALYELGRSHRLCGEFKEAIACFDHALEIPYERPASFNRKGSCESRRQRLPVSPTAHFGRCGCSVYRV